MVHYSSHRRVKNGLTVVLVDSPSDWEPWVITPFDACPPAKTTAIQENRITFLNMEFESKIWNALPLKDNLCELQLTI